MKSQWLIAAALAAGLILGCANNASQTIASNRQQKETPIAGLDNYTLGKPISYGNVTVIPVSNKVQEQAAKDFITLAEAKKNNWIEITENPGDEQVDSLQVKNTGPKPILLMVGDLLLGGKQDRVVARDTVVQVGQTTNVPVYCVEPGRWTGSSTTFAYDEIQVPASVKEAAIAGNQEDVWSEVGTYNAAVGANGGRTTIASGLSEHEVEQAITALLPKFMADIKGNQNVVGAVFVLNGKIKWFESFATNKLFNSSIEGILKGILAEAYATKSHEKSEFTIEECADFVKKCLSASKTRTDRQGSGVLNWQVDGDGVRGQELSITERAPGADRVRGEQKIHTAMVAGG